MSATAEAGFHRAGDKTLYATLSLYISSERMEETFKNWSPATRRTLQSRAQQSSVLSKAIDPLFNDISIRDRNAAVDEFLLDFDGAKFVEQIRITIPNHVRWETEGQKFEARLGANIGRELACRTFWYVHPNGALSFHMSIQVPYEHRLTDFYFLSMLQKLMFPKEFQSDAGYVQADICSGRTGVWLLDWPTVRCRAELAGEEGSGQANDGAKGNRANLPYWTFVRRLASAQLALLANVAGLEPRGAELHPAALWGALVGCDATSFIEIPGIRIPQARSVFFLLDSELFQLLQPAARDSIRRQNGYGAMMPENIAPGDSVIIDVPAIEQTLIAHGGALDVRYYFLAGFFQNIIDFLNQDVSELRDGTDPAYPRTKEQQEEALFVRYANGRSLFQVAATSRSLDVGNNYIGTCPYLFLVHLMALHNEFLIRRYEAEVAALQNRLEDPGLTELGNIGALLGALSTEAPSRPAVPAREIHKATAQFYAFRLKAFTVFKRHLYDNTLRYDTERDLYTELERIRGIGTRIVRCESIVAGLDRTMKDLEDDKRYREQREARHAENRLSKLVGVVGLFSVAQASFQAVDAYRALFEGAQPKCKLANLWSWPPFCPEPSAADLLALFLQVGTAAGAAVVLVYFLRIVLGSRDR